MKRSHSLHRITHGELFCLQRRYRFFFHWPALAVSAEKNVTECDWPVILPMLRRISGRSQIKLGRTCNRTKDGIDDRIVHCPFGGRISEEANRAGTRKSPREAHRMRPSNNVNNEPPKLRTAKQCGEIQFGSSVQVGSPGRFRVFNQIPYQPMSKRERTDLSSGSHSRQTRTPRSRGGKVDLIFPQLHGKEGFFRRTYNSVAMQVDS